MILLDVNRGRRWTRRDSIFLLNALNGGEAHIESLAKPWAESLSANEQQNHSEGAARHGPKESAASTIGHSRRHVAAAHPAWLLERALFSAASFRTEVAAPVLGETGGSRSPRVLWTVSAAHPLLNSSNEREQSPNSIPK